MINIKILEELSNAFGPSGFEDEVTNVIKKHCNEMIIENVSMINVYSKL